MSSAVAVEQIASRVGRGTPRNRRGRAGRRRAYARAAPRSADIISRKASSMTITTPARLRSRLPAPGRRARAPGPGARRARDAASPGRRLGPAVEQEQRVEQHTAALLLQAGALESAPQQQVGSRVIVGPRRSWRAAARRAPARRGRDRRPGRPKARLLHRHAGSGTHPVGGGGAVELGTHGRAGTTRRHGGAGGGGNAPDCRQWRAWPASTGSPAPLRRHPPARPAIAAAEADRRAPVPAVLSASLPPPRARGPPVSGQAPHRRCPGGRGQARPPTCREPGQRRRCVPRARAPRPWPAPWRRRRPARPRRRRTAPAGAAPPIPVPAYRRAPGPESSSAVAASPMASRRSSRTRNRASAAPSSVGIGAASSVRCSPASVGSAIAEGNWASRSAIPGGTPFAQSGPPRAASASARPSDVASGGVRSSTLIGAAGLTGAHQLRRRLWRGEQGARYLLSCGRPDQEQDRDGRWPERGIRRESVRGGLAW